jgi:hypothetical protein
MNTLWIWMINHGLTAPAAAELRTVIGYLFKNETALNNTLANFTNAAELQSSPIYFPLLQLSIVADCGKNQLLPGSLSVLEGSPLTDVPKEMITAAFLPDPAWNINATPKNIAIDAEQGRMKYLNGQVPGRNMCVMYHYGFSGDIGAGTYDRSKVELSEPTLVILPGGGAYWRC